MKHRKHKIYYGAPGDTELFWLVKVVDAKKDVVLNGTMADAIAGIRGLTIGCHLSNCCDRHKKSFPHEYHMASFTKTTCTVISKIRNGVPAEGVLYSHSLGSLVELNDRDKEKKYLKLHPELAQKQFVLRVPRKRKPVGSQAQGRSTGPRTGARFSRAPRGAIKRAHDAGLLNDGVYKLLKRMDEEKQTQPTRELAAKALKQMKGEGS